MPLNIANPVNCHHIGMLQARDRPRFQQESLLLLAVRIEGVDELDRDRSIQDRVLGQIHSPHRASADAALELVTVEFGGRLPIVRAGFDAARSLRKPHSPH